MESAASIKRGGRSAPRIPTVGSKLRAFYDSLHRAAESGGFVPRMDGDDVVEIRSHIEKLTLFYGMDISTIKRVGYSTRLGEKGVVGWRLIGQHVGREYYTFGTVFRPPNTVEHSEKPSNARRPRRGQPPGPISSVVKAAGA